MNEQNEIEQLKRERDEILAKVEELDKLTHDPEGGINWPQVHAIFEELKALKPKPERLRLWVVKYPSGSLTFCRDPNDAKQKQHPGGRIVPMIEVRPLPELPEMEEWGHQRPDSKGVNIGGTIHWADTPNSAKHFVDAHNATVRAFKKWAEEAEKADEMIGYLEETERERDQLRARVADLEADYRELARHHDRECLCGETFCL